MGAALTRKLFNRYRALRESLTSCRSTAGTLIKLGPLGSDGGAEYRRSHAVDDRHLEYAHLVYLFEHLLTADELRVIAVLETALPHAKRCAQWDGEGKPCDCGALKYYERTVRDGELVVTIRKGEDAAPVQETARGEWVIGPARYPKDHERAGEVVDGWSRVAGRKPVYPTRTDAARLLGITVRLLRRRLEAAHEKIEIAAHGETLSEL